MNLRPKIEKLAVLGAIGTALWSARLVFIFLIGDHWFGTLGITSILFGTLTYLSWHGKMGRFGRIYKEILDHKLAKKMDKTRLCFAGFFIFFTVLMSVGGHAAVYYPEETRQTLTMVKENNPELENPQEVGDVIPMLERQVGEDPWLIVPKIILGFLLIPFFAILNFPLWSAGVGALNELFHGHLLHIIDIILVEEIEILGILLYVRHLQRKPKSISTS